jgi:hypothetical protein
MSRTKDLGLLQDLSRLLLDQRLAQLRAAAERCDRSRMQIAALDRGGEPSDLSPLSAAQVALRYQGWADRRRGELNIVLARQTVDWLQARQEAQTAFGRAEALRSLAERQLSKG